MQAQEEPALTLSESIKSLFKTVSALINNIFSMLVLELQLAAKSVLYILGLFIFCTLLLISAWFCLVAAFISWLVISFAVSLTLAILLAGIINLLVIPFLFLFIKRLSKNLKFSHTCKQLGRNDG